MPDKGAGSKGGAKKPKGGKTAGKRGAIADKGVIADQGDATRKK